MCINIIDLSCSFLCFLFRLLLKLLLPGDFFSFLFTLSLSLFCRLIQRKIMDERELSCSRECSRGCFETPAFMEGAYEKILLCWVCVLYFVFITTYYLEIPLEYLFFSLSLLLTVVFFRFTRYSENMIQLSISLYIFNLVFS